MRKPYPSYSLLTVAGLFLAGSCSIIAEVDRTKIPQDNGTAAEGGQATGGSGGSTGGTGARGGTAGDAGSSGSAGKSGAGGEGGMGGEPGGGQSGTDMGGAGMAGAGMGGEGGVIGAACGDGAVDSGEQCDDGDTMGNDGCSATCQKETGWNCNTAEPSVCTPICGDGLVVGSEPCDDGNTLACGTCSGNAGGTATGCNNLLTAKASGSVTPVTAMDLDEGASFVLDDGFNPAVTFEFDSDASVVESATLKAINFTTATTDAELQAAIVTAVNGVGATLLVTASNGASARQVALIHDRVTGRGNQTIMVTSADITVVGMAGGLAGNCPSGTACKADADCQSFDCDGTGHCAP